MPHLTNFDFSLPLAFMFDLDGTILDSTKWHMQAFHETLARYAPKKLPKFEEDIIKGRGSKEVFLALGFTDEKEILKLVEHKRELYNGYIKNKKVSLFEGVKDLLYFLKSRNRILILVTSSCNNTATLCLESNELDKIFDYVITGEVVEFGKPAPDIFRCALQLAKLESCQAVTIEDSEIGIQASTAAGISAVLVNKKTEFPNVCTFSTFNDLLNYVRCDFEKAELGTLLQAILLEENVSPKITWNDNFGDKPLNYNPTSDQELFNVFKLASRGKKRVRLLRIGGPLLFRKMVISILNPTGSTESRNNDAIRYILDNRIPSIRILIADPDGVPFLTRLDYEKSGTWGIWRVREETLKFARSLCRLAENPREVEVGFHRGELIWNLGIVGETTILVRAYGKGTGHDSSVVSQWLKTGEEVSFAESFTNYWESIARRADTTWMRLDFFKDCYENKGSEPKWPSLFKGNAVLSKREDLDKEDYGRTIPREYVPKICRHRRHHAAEKSWLSIDKKLRKSFKNFRPVGKVTPRELVSPGFEGDSVAMEKLIGFSLFEVANEIINNEKSKENPEAAFKLLDEILLDSVKALKEFRDHSNSVISEDRRRLHPSEILYPYDIQLIDALNNVRSLIGPISRDIFDAAIKDVSKLGQNLISKISVPFRDAQLKNRIWVTNESISELVSRLLTIVHDNSALQSEIKNIRDIDFETSGFDVTPWDDIIHILFFEKSGIFFYEKEEKGKLKHLVDPIKSINSYKEWLGEVDDKTGLWMTVLARSIREFCRRLWYACTMPNTYKRRYEHERSDYFLDLALYAAQKLPTYEKIRELLVEIKESPEVWSNMISNCKANNDKDKSGIELFHQKRMNPITDEVHYDYDIAISCASEDIEYVINVANSLKANNVKVYFYIQDDEQAESLGTYLTTHFMRIFRDASRYCVIFASENYLKKKYTKFESLCAIDRELLEEGYIIPVKIDDTEIPWLPRTKCYFNLRNNLPDKLCKLILLKLEK